MTIKLAIMACLLSITKCQCNGEENMQIRYKKLDNIITYPFSTFKVSCLDCINFSSEMPPSTSGCKWWKLILSIKNVT